jgi:hypothetical protein
MVNPVSDPSDQQEDFEPDQEMLELEDIAPFFYVLEVEEEVIWEEEEEDEELIEALVDSINDSVREELAQDRLSYWEPNGLAKDWSLYSGPDLVYYGCFTERDSVYVEEWRNGWLNFLTTNKGAHVLHGNAAENYDMNPSEVSPSYLSRILRTTQWWPIVPDCFMQFDNWVHRPVAQQTAMVHPFQLFWSLRNGVWRLCFNHEAILTQQQLKSTFSMSYTGSAMTAVTGFKTILPTKYRLDCSDPETLGIVKETLKSLLPAHEYYFLEFNFMFVMNNPSHLFSRPLKNIFDQFDEIQPYAMWGLLQEGNDVVCPLARKQGCLPEWACLAPDGTHLTRDAWIDLLTTNVGAHMINGNMMGRDLIDALNYDQVWNLTKLFDQSTRWKLGWQPEFHSDIRQQVEKFCSTEQLVGKYAGLFFTRGSSEERFDSIHDLIRGDDLFADYSGYKVVQSYICPLARFTLIGSTTCSLRIEYMDGEIAYVLNGPFNIHKHIKELLANCVIEEEDSWKALRRKIKVKNDFGFHRTKNALFEECINQLSLKGYSELKIKEAFVEIGLISWSQMLEF